MDDPTFGVFLFSLKDALECRVASFPLATQNGERL